MTPTALAAWSVMAALAAVTDLTMMYRRLTGHGSRQAQHDIQTIVARYGPGRALAIAVALDILAPPLVLAACAWRYVQGQKQLAAERQAGREHT